MKRTILFGAVLFLAVVVAGCGGGGGGGTVVTPVITDIPSTRAEDAYVGENLNTLALSAPVAGSGAIRVGFDPLPAPLGTEYRGLINFSLGGPNGVPLGATIVSATLDVIVNTVQFTSSLPIRIDMIDAPPPFVSNDYDVVIVAPVVTLPPSSTGFTVTTAGRYLVDVTPIMELAQTMELPSLQLRLLVPLGEPAVGLVTFDDSALATQPFLTVEYF